MSSSLFALIDDLAVLLDDLAVLTKAATKKTAGVLGDDLALNAEQVMGLRAERELPVVWAVAKGSMRNKAILVPAAIALSAFLPSAVQPLLIAGGAFLCFEGFEKLAHKYLEDPAEEAAHHGKLVSALATGDVDLVALERDKVRGAIRTDLILSAEIIAIALGTVTDAPLTTRIGVLVGIAVVMTVGVYGLVAGIVKLDDAGLALQRRASGAAKAVGGAIVVVAPKLMKLLSIAGTIAVFLVGGGIVAHGMGPVHHFIGALEARGDVVSWIGPSLVNGAVGLATGLVTVLAFHFAKKALPKKNPANGPTASPARAAGPEQSPAKPSELPSGTGAAEE